MPSTSTPASQSVYWTIPLDERKAIARFATGHRPKSAPPSITNRTAGSPRTPSHRLRMAITRSAKTTAAGMMRPIEKITPTVSSQSGAAVYVSTAGAVNAHTIATDQKPRQREPGRREGVAAGPNGNEVVHDGESAGGEPQADKCGAEESDLGDASDRGDPWDVADEEGEGERPGSSHGVPAHRTGVDVRRLGGCDEGAGEQDHPEEQHSVGPQRVLEILAAFVEADGHPDAPQHDAQGHETERTSRRTRPRDLDTP